jgi:endonuclease/exonuclease/phosphatase family metal-dependent hydrolase
MSCACWNGPGVGKAATVKELRDFARTYAPTVLCVVETQVHKVRAEGLKNTLGYDKSFAVSSSGRKGGIVIYWNNTTSVEILPYSQYHIDAIVSDNGGEPWRLTCVYGEAQAHLRFKTWDMLKFIKSSCPHPWMCIGNFNEVLHRSEHVGVQERSLAQIAGFREMVDVCGLRDLGFTGRSWTYEKKVTGGSYCRVRLDRALASAEWCSRFPLATVENLAATSSDHGPILLRWDPKLDMRTRRGRRSSFKYELMWETHTDFSSMMSQTWQKEGDARSLPELQQKLSHVAEELQGWGRSTFGHVTMELRQLRGELEKMQGDPTRTCPSHAEIKVSD